MSDDKLFSVSFSNQKHIIYKNLLNCLEENASFDFDLMPNNPYLKSLLTSTQIFTGSIHETDINYNQFLAYPSLIPKLLTDSLYSSGISKVKTHSQISSKSLSGKKHRVFYSSPSLKPTTSFKLDSVIYCGLESFLFELFTQNQIRIPNNLTIFDFKILGYIISKTSGQRVIIRFFNEQQKSLKTSIQKNKKASTIWPTFK